MQGLEELHYYTINNRTLYIYDYTQDNDAIALEGLNLKLVVLLSLANDNSYSKKQS